MITNPDTTAASGVHQLTGSSPSTGTAPGFAPVVTAPFIPRANAADAEIIDLASEHERLAAVHEASFEALSRAEDAFVEVSLPDALRFREATDAASIGGYQNLDEPYGYTAERKLEELRTFRYSRPEHQHRRDEIVAAYDQWRADRQAALNAAGFPEAWNKVTADAEAASTIRRDMIGRPALTMDGILSKVGVALSCYQGIEGIQEELAEQASNSGGETMLLSIMVDLGRMLMARRTAETASAACSNIVEVALTVCADPVPMTPSREIVESYRTFLDMEFRFLNWETHRSLDPVGGIWLDNPAGAFHGLDSPPPSSRAAAVLGLLGLMPERTGDPEPEPETRVA